MPADIKSAAIIGFKQSAIPADKEKEVKLRKASADFEAIILRQLLKVMRESIPKDGLFGESYSKEMYMSLHDSALADGLAHGKGTGLGELIYRQLSGQVSSSTIKR